VVEIVAGKGFYFAMRFGITAIDKTLQFIAFGLLAKNFAQET
jgi:hypothetical protein